MAGMFDDFNDFDLDDLGGSSAGDSFDSFDNSTSIGNGGDSPAGSFDDFSNPDSDNSDNGGSPKKTAIKVAALGIGIIVVAFLLVGIINKVSSGAKAEITGSNNTQTTQQTTSNQSNQSQQSTATSNGWVKFTEASGLTFATNYTDATFTITDINHYVKVVDSENNVEVKTVLTGSLSGFIGTYELEVPYYKGIKLNIGNHFDVKVQIGKTSGGKMVVGEIAY